MMRRILGFWLMTSAFWLTTVAQPQYLFQTALPTSPDSRYEVGQEAELRIVAHVGGVPLDGVEVTWEAGNDMMPVDTTGKAAINAVGGPKTIFVTPKSGHWSYPAAKQKGVAFLKRMFEGWL